MAATAGVNVGLPPLNLLDFIDSGGVGLLGDDELGDDDLAFLIRPSS